jgi:hypothetical protein
MLFKEIIAVYNKKHTKPMNTKYKSLVNVKAAGTHSYHSALKG